jgi:hypothetical protein
MTKKLINILSVSLAVVFLTPLVIKFLDGRFHHHERIVYDSGKECHFHEYHKKCPVPGFEFSFYALYKNSVETKKQCFLQKVTINYVSTHFSDQSKYSFLLRAPPVYISIRTS